MKAQALVLSVFTLSLTLPSFSAHAARIPGSACGLSDYYGGDDEGEEEIYTLTGRQIDLSRMSDAEILALPALAKRQILAAAELELADMITSGEYSVTGILSAVRGLRKFSGGETVTLNDFDYQGRRFTQVKYFPGDNPGGVIFKRDSTDAIATINDSDINCLSI